VTSNELSGLSQLSGRALLPEDALPAGKRCRWSYKIDGGDLIPLSDGACTFNLPLPEEFSALRLLLDINGESRNILLIEKEN
jgi:hypothetical protein